MPFVKPKHKHAWSNKIYDYMHGYRYTLPNLWKLNFIAIATGSTAGLIFSYAPPPDACFFCGVLLSMKSTHAAAYLIPLEIKPLKCRC